VGLTLTRPEIADSYKGLTISTFGGNPVTCAAAKATIDLIEEDRLMDNAETVGNHLHAGLEALKEKYAIIGDVRGMGLMQGIELVKDRKSKEPAADLTNQLLERTRVHGLLVGKGGLYANVVRMSPPLNISKADADTALAALDKSLEEITVK
jgi:4-aminobutyrate aminotransferase